MIDHKKRIGRPYSPKPPSDEQRRKLSETMKAFNEKTGKLTLMGNRIAVRSRGLKAKENS